MTKLGIGVSHTLQSSSGSLISGPTEFVMTVTTTSTQNLTLTELGVITGKTVLVKWGDGSENIYSGTALRSHLYSGAGVWTVRISNALYINRLNLQDVKITSIIVNKDNLIPTNLTFLQIGGLPGLNWTVSTTAPIPTGLTSLSMTSVANFIWTVNSINPVPSGLTYLYLNNLSNFTWTVNSTVPLPAGLNSFTLFNIPNFTWTVSTTAPMPTGLTSLVINTVPNFTWTVSPTTPMPTGLTILALTAAPNITWSVSPTTPMPTGLLFLAFNTIPNITWTVSPTTPMPTGLTTLAFTSMPGITWTVSPTTPMPTGLTTLGLVAVSNISLISDFPVAAIRSIQYENNLTQAQLTTVLSAIYNRRASYTYATPVLDISGSGNAAPSGVYADEDPPTTGKGYIYELMNDPEGEGFKKWTITYTP